MVTKEEVVEYPELVRAFYRGGTTEWLKSERNYLDRMNADRTDLDLVLHVDIIDAVLAERA